MYYFQHLPGRVDPGAPHILRKWSPLPLLATLLWRGGGLGGCGQNRSNCCTQLRAASCISARGALTSLASPPFHGPILRSRMFKALFSPLYTDSSYPFVVTPPPPHLPLGPSPSPTLSFRSPSTPTLSPLFLLRAPSAGWSSLSPSFPGQR